MSHSNIVQQGLRRAKKDRQTDTDKCWWWWDWGRWALKIDATLIACNKTCDS